MNYKRTIVLVLICLLNQIGFAVTEADSRFVVENNCNETLWVQQDYLHYTNDPVVVKIPSKGAYAYDVPRAGLGATRFWGKLQCDNNGYNCKVGESTHVPNSPQLGPFAPDINSKFEATWGCIVPGNCARNPSDPANSLGTETWWNGSAVDGYTLPYEILVFDHNNSCKDIQTGIPIEEPGVYCGDLDPNSCPTSADLSTEGQYKNLNGYSMTNVNLQWKVDGKPVGCFSPCSKLTVAQGSTYNSFDNQGGTKDGGWKYVVGGTRPNGIEPDSPEAQMYCCPTPPISPENCSNGPAARSDYSKSIAAQRCNSYTYAYDDAKGLARCRGETRFRLVFCPHQQGNPGNETVNISFNGGASVLAKSKFNSTQISPNSVYNLVSTGIVSLNSSGNQYSCEISVTGQQVNLKSGTLCQYLQVNNSVKPIAIKITEPYVTTKSLRFELKGTLKDVKYNGQVINASTTYTLQDTSVISALETNNTPLTCNLLLDNNLVVKNNGLLCPNITIDNNQTPVLVVIDNSAKVIINVQFNFSNKISKVTLNENVVTSGASYTFTNVGIVAATDSANEAALSCSLSANNGVIVKGQGSLCDRVQLSTQSGSTLISIADKSNLSSDMRFVIPQEYKATFNDNAITTNKTYTVKNNDVLKVTLTQDQVTSNLFCSFSLVKDGNNTLVKTNAGNLCTQLVIDNNQKSITVLPLPTNNLQFIVTYNTQVNMQVYLNEFRINSGEILNSRALPETSVLKVTQGASTATCSLKFNNSNISKVNGYFCEFINITNENIPNIQLPASIPSAPNPNPNPTPSSGYVLFGVAADIEVNFAGVKVTNGTKVALKDLTGTTVILSAKQGSNAASCTFNVKPLGILDKNQKLCSMLAFNPTPDAQGNFYLGLPNPIPNDSSTPPTPPNPGPSTGTYLGIPPNMEVKIGNTTFNFGGGNNRYTFNAPSTLIIMRNTVTNKAKSCTIGNSSGVLRVVNPEGACQNIVVNKDTIAFPQLN